MATPGFPIMIGAGHHFTMAGGITVLEEAGFGFRIPDGDRLG